ncbi:MAG: initiation factor 2B [Halobacteriales archaeon]
MTDATHVVTAFLRNGGRILLLRRSDAVGTYEGQWGGVSGYAEGDPDGQVWAEIDEETGLADAVDLVRSGRPVEFQDADLEQDWTVHPYLFDCDRRGVEVSDEHVAYEWVHAPEIRRRETVPELWTAYERVTPSVRTIAADDDHGSAHLSIVALEILRDRAAVTAHVVDDGAEAADELARLARRLIEARPSMAALRNRVNRVMAGADGPGAVEAVAADAIDRAAAADEGAARIAAERVAGERVLTLSRSGTVLTAFRGVDRDENGAENGSPEYRETDERAHSGDPEADDAGPAPPERLYVAESRPAREGIGVAEALAGTLPVTVHTDAAVAHVLAEEAVDAVLVGADTVLPDGRVLNKTGTRTVAAAAAHEDVPVLVVAAADKVSPDDAVNREFGPASDLYDGDAQVEVLNPTFDVTPADLVDAVVTERGALSTDAIGSVAEDHREHADWSP